MEPLVLVSNALVIGGSIYLANRARIAWRREMENDRRCHADAQEALQVLAGCSPGESRFLGCLLAGAAGDALGRMTESLPRWLTRWRYGIVRDYHQGVLRPVRGRGHYTDDTQLTLTVARSIDDRGEFQPDQLRQEIVDWLDYRIGAGRATVASAQRLRSGTDWPKAGDPTSGGNGSAMRVAPIGLVYHGNRDRLLGVAASSSIGTHSHPLAVAAAQLMASAVALALEYTPETFSGTEFLGRLPQGVNSPAWQERLQLLQSWLENPTDEALRRIGTGGFVLESVAAAFYLFARDGLNLEKAVVTAVNAGGDTDSVASMVGNLCGALHGHRAIPERWLRDLQHRDYIVLQAHRLFGLSREAVG